MKFGHYSNEELGIKRNITCSMFESKGVVPGRDVQCGQGKDLKRDAVRLFCRYMEDYCCVGKGSFRSVEDIAQNLFWGGMSPKKDWAGDVEYNLKLDGEKANVNTFLRFYFTGDSYNWKNNLAGCLMNEGYSKAEATRAAEETFNAFAKASKPYAEKMYARYKKEYLGKKGKKDKKMSNDLDELSAELEDQEMDNELDELQAGLEDEQAEVQASVDEDMSEAPDELSCAITDARLGKAIKKKVFAQFGNDFEKAKKIALIRIRRIILAGNKKSSWVHLYNDFLPKLEQAIKEAGTFKVKGVEERVPQRQLREIGRAIEDEFCEMIDAATEQVKKELKKEGIKVDNLGKALKLSNMIDKEMAEGDEESDNAKDVVCYNTEAASKWSDKTRNLYGIDHIRQTAREGHAAAEKGEKEFKAWLDKTAQELRAAKAQLRREVSDGYDYAKLVHHIDSFAIQVSAKLARDCIHHKAQRLDRMCSNNRVEQVGDVACEMPSKPIMRIITDARKEMAQNDKRASELEKKLNAANEYDQELESEAYDFLNVRTQKQKDRIAQIRRMDKKGLVNIDELEQECEQNASANFLQVRKALKAYKARAKKNRK